jgi:hypothetical protein
VEVVQGRSDLKGITASGTYSARIDDNYVVEKTVDTHPYTPSQCLMPSSESPCVRDVDQTLNQALPL